MTRVSGRVQEYGNMILNLYLQYIIVKKFAKSLNMEVGINVEGGILWKKLMHNSNKRGVEGGKNLRNQ